MKHQKGFGLFLLLIPIAVIATTILVVTFIKKQSTTTNKTNSTNSESSVSITSEASVSPTPLVTGTTQNNTGKRITPTTVNKPNKPSNTTDSGNSSNNSQLSPTPLPTSSSGLPTNFIPYQTTTPTTHPTNTPTPVSVPTVRVTYPNGGEVMTEGDTKTITWEATGDFSSFVLGYSSCPSCLGNIAVVSGSDRSYSWKVSVGNTTNTQFKIEIVSYPRTYTGPNPVDFSDNNFTVYQNPACDTGCP